MKKPLLSELTLREKIGQTLNMRPSVMAEADDINEYFRKNPYGSMWTCGHIKMDFVNLAEELSNSDHIDYDMDIKIRLFSEQVSSVLKAPFLSAMDAERGCNRVFPFFSETTSNTGIAATNDPKAAYEIAKCIAHELKLAGTRWDWGPVIDNPSPFASSSISRAFSSDPDLIEKMAVEYIKGVQSENVAATLKHFPGSDKHEYRDSHFSDCTLRQSMEEWWERQGKVFQACIDAGVYSIMLSHKSFPAADDTKIGGRYIPTTMSKKIVTDLLKEKMGFKGVVITDAVDMKSITSMFTTAEEFYISIYNAGCDVILGPSQKDIFDIVEKAVLDGKIPESRIDDACQRVLDMKEKLGLFDSPLVYPVTQEDREQAIKNTSDTMKKYASKSISWMCRRNDLIPVKKEEIKKVQIVYIGYSNDILNNIENFVKPEFEKRGAIVSICDGIKNAQHMQTIADENDLILYFAHLAPHCPYGVSGFFQEKATQFLNVMRFGNEKSICAGTCSPFVYNDWFPSATNFVNLFWASREILQTYVAGIYGEVEFEGVCPYDADPLAPRK